MKLDYEVGEISLKQAGQIVHSVHYGNQLLNFHPCAVEYKFYGLLHNSEIVGATQYTRYNWNRHNKVKHDDLFGCHTEDCEGFWELSRLAVLPLEEHNITSWFLSKTMKMINAKIILTVAEEEKEGTIYSATNFDYYGIMYERDYSGMDKPFHVFLRVYDKTLKPKWDKKRLDKSEIHEILE